MTTSHLLDLGAERFVLLTTYRKTGASVSTTVWIARDGERLLVTTPSSTGKVKRLRHTPDVTLVPCTMRGVVRPGSAPITGRATLHDDTPTLERLDRAMLAKYGVQYRLARAVRRLSGKLRATTAIAITARDSGAADTTRTDSAEIGGPA